MKANKERIATLEHILGSDYVKMDPDTTSSYAVDGMIPWAVVFPSEAEEVSEVVRFASKERLALIPWGNGTKMSMGYAPSRLDLVICTRRLNRIIDIDTGNLTVTAQSGVRFRDIQVSLSSEENRCYLPYEDPNTLAEEVVCSERDNKGCFIPLTPPYSHSATLGGIIASNSSGPRRLLYGLPRDLVLGIRFVAPDGEIIGAGGKTVKNVSGYDICKLMIGSRGSLGILCEMTLRLLPLPERLGTSLFTFERLSGASGFIDRVFETRLLPATVEVLNGKAYELLSPDMDSTIGVNGYRVAVALEGCHEAVDRMASELREMASTLGAQGGLYLEDESHTVFWDAYGNLMDRLSVRHQEVISFKLSYPISRYLEIMERIESLSSNGRMEKALQVDAGSGIALLHILGTAGAALSAEEVSRIAVALLEACQSIGGTMVVERAEPHLKQKLPVWGAPREDLMMTKRIKEQLDPWGLLSPGRFVGGI